jgi:hypothetical protein
MLAMVVLLADFPEKCRPAIRVFGVFFLRLTLDNNTDEVFFLPVSMKPTNHSLLVLLTQVKQSITKTASLPGVVVDT